uniref:hypothetical protein n=1 Tax=Agathobacter rectalis TaxID=39491 RepID=UPI004026BC03
MKNQILVTESSLKYTTAATVGKKISTASTYIDIFDAGISAVSSGVKRYGQVSKDGKVDIVAELSKEEIEDAMKIRKK